MGLFICELCNEQLNGDQHKCNSENIRKHVHTLQDATRTSEMRLSNVCNAMFRVMEPLGPLDSDEITVKTDWLRKLWQSTQCQWYEAKTPESFLVRWMATHRILIEAFQLFKSKNTKSLLEKLKTLKDACNRAQEVLGYRDSKLDLTPEDIVSNSSN